MSWHACELLNGPISKPEFVLHGELAQWFADRSLRAQVSISDERDTAVAFVVVEELRHALARGSEPATARRSQHAVNPRGSPCPSVGAVEEQALGQLAAGWRLGLHASSSAITGSQLALGVAAVAGCRATVEPTRPGRLRPSRARQHLGLDGIGRARQPARRRGLGGVQQPLAFTHLRKGMGQRRAGRESAVQQVAAAGGGHCAQPVRSA